MVCGTKVIVWIAVARRLWTAEAISRYRVLRWLVRESLPGGGNGEAWLSAVGT